MKRTRGADAVAAESMAIGDALRESGFGEKRLAAEMRGLLKKLGGEKGDSKLLLEALKECGRHLQASYERGLCVAEIDGGAGGGRSVELVHNVARPVRGGADEKQIGFQFRDDKEKS